ncbi:hypothetical protein SCHPADRAFT_890596 [Schizopora paradoxa]|uniref:DUF6533 domain-containing protein n=1 Tax=Schizopora paradoxa TaxID=27342 RepID=A0A0H2RL87_9AGAM|nr:hypothetical protein SCHPADRAFT_890596 [Schizopora paradoxa]
MSSALVSGVSELVKQGRVVKNMHSRFHMVFKRMACQSLISLDSLFVAGRHVTCGCLVPLNFDPTDLFKANLDPHSCEILNRTSTYFVVAGIIIAESLFESFTRMPNTEWSFTIESCLILAYLVAVELALTIAGVINVRASLNGLQYDVSLVPSLIPCFPSAQEFRVYIDFASVLFMDVMVSLANLILFATMLNTSYYFILLEPQRVLHSTLSARLIRNVKKEASGDPKLHFSSVSKGLGSLEFRADTTSTGSLEFADTDSFELHDLIVINHSEMSDEAPAYEAVYTNSTLHGNVREEYLVMSPLGAIRRQENRYKVPNYLSLELSRRSKLPYYRILKMWLKNAGQVKHVWLHKGNLGNALYFATRYTILADMVLLSIFFFDSGLEPKTCEKLAMAFTSILVIRTWAAWHQSRMVLNYLLLIFIARHSGINCLRVTQHRFIVRRISLYEISHLIEDVIYLILLTPLDPSSPLPDIIPCFVDKTTIKVFIDYAILLFMDLNVLALTVWSAFEQLKGSGSRLIRTFYQDAFRYLLCLSAFSFTNLLLSAFISNTLWYFTILEAERVAHSVLSARLIRNVRKAVECDAHFKNSPGPGRRCTGFGPSSITSTGCILEKIRFIMMYLGLSMAREHSKSNTEYGVTPRDEKATSMLDERQVVRQATIVKNVHVVTYTLLIYDIFENFEDEVAQVTYVWLHRGFIGNALYFATRYLSLVDMTVMSTYFFKPNLSPNACKKLNVTFAYFVVFGIIIAEIILIIRTWAVWHKSNAIYYGTFSWYLWCSSLEGSQMSRYRSMDITVRMSNQQSPLPNFIPCYAVAAGFRVYVDYATVLFMDLMRGSRSRLTRTFYRDGFIYLFCLCVSSLGNLVLSALSLDVRCLVATLYYFLLLEPERVIHSVLSAHLIRNVRKAAAASPDFSTSSAVTTSRLGGIEFAVNSQAVTAQDSTMIRSEFSYHVANDLRASAKRWVPWRLAPKLGNQITDAFSQILVVHCHINWSTEGECVENRRNLLRPYRSPPIYDLDRRRVTRFATHKDAGVSSLSLPSRDSRLVDTVPSGPE